MKREQYGHKTNIEPTYVEVLGPINNPTVQQASQRYGNQTNPMLDRKDR